MPCGQPLSVASHVSRGNAAIMQQLVSNTAVKVRVARCGFFCVSNPAAQTPAAAVLLGSRH